MSLEPFARSRLLTLGVELELQIVGGHDFDLVPASGDLLRLMRRHRVPGEVKPEITSSMVELSTDVCENHMRVLSELRAIRDALVDSASRLDLHLCGGGTHPFQQWHRRRIYDTPRFHELSALYGYLTKQFTVFGQHVHIGCPSADGALHLLHSLSRFVPHAIALAASSPFVQGQDTGFHSARLNSVSAFPLSGRAPCLLTWAEFERFFAKMARTGVVKGMKDFYWDIRPKPEFGTIEVRVLDTPLTIEKAAALAAYLQCLARWLDVEKPFEPAEDDYLVYTFNRFQACRFGLDATYVDPASGEHRALRDDVLASFERIGAHAEALGAVDALELLRREVTGGGNDAGWLRAAFEREPLLPEVVRQASLRWHGTST